MAAADPKPSLLLCLTALYDQLSLNPCMRLEDMAIFLRNELDTDMTRFSISRALKKAEALIGWPLPSMALLKNATKLVPRYPRCIASSVAWLPRPHRLNTQIDSKPLNSHEKVLKTLELLVLLPSSACFEAIGRAQLAGPWLTKKIP